MMKNIFNSIRGFFKRKCRLSSAAIENKLSAEALVALKVEADFLCNTHGVAVRALEMGEKPSKPKAVDAAIEEELRLRLT